MGKARNIVCLDTALGGPNKAVVTIREFNPTLEDYLAMDLRMGKYAEEIIKSYGDLPKS